MIEPINQEAMGYYKLNIGFIFIFCIIWHDLIAIGAYGNKIIKVILLGLQISIIILFKIIISIYNKFKLTYS